MMVAMLLAPLVGQAQDAAPDQGLGKEALLWRVVYSDFPPYSITVGGSNPDGLSVDVLEALAAQAGAKVDYIETANPREAVAAIREGRADIHLHLANTPARRDLLDFSVPYETVRVSLYKAAGSSFRPGQPGARIGFTQGSVAAYVARRLEDVRLVEFPNNEALLSAVTHGRVDAALYVVGAIERLANVLGLQGRFLRVGDPLLSLPVAFAVSKSRPDIREAIDAALRRFAASSQFDRVRNKWFPVEPRFTRDQWIASIGAIVLLVALAALLVHEVSSRRARKRMAERLESQAHELTAATTEVRRSEYLLSRVLGASQASLVALGEARRVVLADERVWQMLGFEQAVTAWPASVRFLDRESLNPIEPDDDPINRTLDGFIVHGEIYAFQTREGSDPMFLRVSGTQVDAPGTPLRHVISIEDVTAGEQGRQSDERANRFDMLGRLTGGVIHDFNNILGTVLGAVQLAARFDPPERIRTELQVAETAARKGAELTNRLGAFLRKRPVGERDFAVAGALEDIAHLAERVMNQAVEVEVARIDPGINIHCNPGQFENAVLNLVLNARDAISGSGIGRRIVLSVKAALIEGNAWHEVRVQDDGPGMDEATRRRAVYPYFSTKETGKGSGLGLSMVYAFMRQAGGEMQIASKPGAGTTVSLYFPQVHEVPAGHPVQGRPEPAVAIVGQGEHVLVVDDDETAGLVVVRALGSLGYKVTEARSGAQALSILQASGPRAGSSGGSGPIDVLLTDVMMPGMTGFELAAEARKHRPDLPVIYMSGYVGEDKRAQMSVPAEILMKPCDIVEIARQVKKAIGERPVRREAACIDDFPTARAASAANPEESATWRQF